MSDDMNNTTSALPSPPVLVASAVFIIIAQILCVGLNFLLICSLVSRPKLRGNSFVFISSMIFADMLTVLLDLMPLTGNYLAMYNLMGAYCPAESYIQTMGDGVIMWHVGFILLNNYVLLSNHDFFVRLSSISATFMQLIFSWSLPLLVMISGMIGNLGNSLYYEKVNRCVFFRESSMTLLAFHTVIGITLPGSIALVSAGITLYNIHKIHTQVWDKETSLENSGFRMDHNSHTAIFTVIAVRLIIAFFLEIIARETRTYMSGDALIFFDVIINFMDCTNPMVYAIVSVRYRNAFYELLCCHTADDSSNIGGDSQEDLKMTESHGPSLAGSTASMTA